jgi:hypothetical protein
VSLDTRFAGSSPAEEDRFLRAMKIRNVEVKPSAPCRKILRHGKIPAKYDRDTSLAKLMDISRQVSPCFDTRCLCWYLPESSGG